MTSRLVGREFELSEVDGFVDRVRDGPASLVLEGEPGIGKTSVWQVAVETGVARDCRVLTCRAAEAEVRLSFTAITDLLEPVLDDVTAALRPPRRRALAVALLLEEPEVEPPDQRTIGAALVDVLRLLAHERPLIVAIDDAHWLDTPSKRALQFALRRVGPSRVGLLATVRGEGVDVPLVAGAHDRRVVVGPLSQDSLHRLLHDQLGLDLTRPELGRLGEVTGGNPLFALEVGRELHSLAERPRGSEPLPVPSTFRELLEERLGRLPSATQDVLLTSATAARPTVEMLETIHGPSTRKRLEQARRAGVIHFEGSRVRYAHPLFAAACYRGAPIWARRASHARLAEVTADLEERARHLALASEAVEASVAQSVAEAAEYAAERGRTAAAGELLELAAELTPTELPARRARQLRAAGFHRLSGDRVRAASVLDELLDGSAGDERADVLLALGRIRRGSVSSSIQLCEEALEATADPARVADIYAYLSFLRILAGDVYGALAAGRAGLERAEHLGDPELLARTIGRVASAEHFTLEITPGLLERGVELERTLARPLGYPESPMVAFGRRLSLFGQVDEAREVLELEETRAEALGDEGTRGQLLYYLAILEWQSGRWNAGLDRCRVALDLAEQLGDQQFRGMVIYARAAILGRLGRVEEARTLAEEASAIADAFGDATFPIWTESLQGFLDLSLGNIGEARERLSPLPARLLAQGWNEPGDPWPELIEVLVDLGELDEAAGLLASFDSLAGRLGAPHALALAARCRGLLEAGLGNIESSLAAYEHALACHERAQHPFELGRTLLVAGRTRRKARQKREARRVLDAAFAVFSELGATLWIARTDEELGRIAGRRPGDGALTRMETQVLELAADGRSNKEIAATLHVSVHTVEAHLTRIYRKVGVHSRTELIVQVGPRVAGPKT